MSKKRNIKARQEKRVKGKRQEMPDSVSDSDETFYFIAGYTSNGAPFGVTWEEMGLKPFEDEETEEDDIKELPF